MQERFDAVGEEDTVLGGEGCSPVLYIFVSTLDDAEICQLTSTSASMSLIKDGVHSRTGTVLG